MKDQLQNIICDYKKRLHVLQGHRDSFTTCFPNALQSEYIQLLLNDIDSRMSIIMGFISDLENVLNEEYEMQKERMKKNTFLLQTEKDMFITRVNPITSEPDNYKVSKKVVSNNGVQITINPFRVNSKPYTFSDSDYLNGDIEIYPAGEYIKNFFKEVKPGMIVRKREYEPGTTTMTDYLVTFKDMEKVNGNYYYTIVLVDMEGSESKFHEINSLTAYKELYFIHNASTNTKDNFIDIAKRYGLVAQLVGETTV